jgi:excisionase family DNA binding protein
MQWRFMPRENDKKQQGQTTRPLLRVSEAAGLLGVSAPTAYRWIAQGRIPAVDTGGKRGMYVPARALAAVLAAEDDAALENLTDQAATGRPTKPGQTKGAGAVTKT